MQIYNYSTTSGSGTAGIYHLRCLLLDHLVTTQTLAKHKTRKAGNQSWETLTDLHRTLYWFGIDDQKLKLRISTTETKKKFLSTTLQEGN